MAKKKGLTAPGAKVGKKARVKWPFPTNDSRTGTEDRLS